MNVKDAGALTAFVMIGTAYMGAAASSLNMIMLDVTMIAALSKHDAAATAVEVARVMGGVLGLVSANCTAHRNILYVGMALCLMPVPFAIFFDWVARYAAAGRMSS